MFWAQRNEVIHVMVDDAKAEAGIVDDGDREAFFLTVIKVFPLPSGEIEELLSVLRQTPEWDPTVSCGFRQVRSSREALPVMSWSRPARRPRKFRSCRPRNQSLPRVADGA